MPSYKNEDETLVKGIHEPIISEITFFKVQDILDGRKKNIPMTNTKREELPLRGFLTCPKCGRKMTGSKSKGAGGIYFYYHCQPGCNGRIRADEVFLTVIKKIAFNAESISFCEKVVEQIIKENQSENSSLRKKLKEKMDALHKKINAAQHLMLDGELKPEEYRELKKQLELEIDRLSRENMEASVIDPDHKKYIEFGLNVLQNLDYYYINGDVSTKQQLISSIFSEKLFFENKNYRTNKLTEAVSLIALEIKELQEEKNERVAEICDPSHRVAPTGFEPVFVP